jgi:iron(III) transport system permease protein
MIWILVLAAGLFFLAPIGGLLSQFHLSSLNEIINDPSFLKSLKVTLVSSGGGALGSVLLALLFARQFANYSWPGKRLQRLFLLIPYLIPNFILAVSYIMAWNPATGLLNSFFRFPFGLYGLTGITILFAIAHMPVAFLLFEEKLKRIDSALKEAARLSGAKSLGVFMRIELPLLKPTLLSAIGLCFALNISAFAIPAWIGAPKHIYPLTYKVYQSIQLGGLDGLPDAASYSVVLLLLALVPLILNMLVREQEKKYVLLSGKSSKPASGLQSLQSFISFQVFFLISQILFWLAPLICLLLSTITKPGCLQSEGVSCLKNISFSHYSYVLFDLPETRAALHGSLFYGAIASVLIVLLSMLVITFFSQNRRAMRLVEAFFSIPLATPGAVIALGLIVVYSGKFGVNLYNTAWIVVIAFIVKHLNLAFQPIKTGFGNISPSLLEAARLSGANQSKVWSKIVFPLLKPEVLGAFFLVFIPIIGELTMSVFLSSNNFRSIGTVLFDLQDYADQASAGALAVLLILLVLCLNEFAFRVSRGKLGY